MCQDTFLFFNSSVISSNPCVNTRNCSVSISSFCFSLFIVYAFQEINQPIISLAKVLSFFRTGQSAPLLCEQKAFSSTRRTCGYSLRENTLSTSRIYQILCRLFSYSNLLNHRFSFIDKFIVIVYLVTPPTSS